MTLVADKQCRTQLRLPHTAVALPPSARRACEACGAATNQPLHQQPVGNTNSAAGALTRPTFSGTLQQLAQQAPQSLPRLGAKRRCATHTSSCTPSALRGAWGFCLPSWPTANRTAVSATMGAAQVAGVRCSRPFIFLSKLEISLWVYFF